LEKLAPGIRAHRSLGCASLCICRVAQGRLDAYVSAALHWWDYAAAVIILREAGGIFHADGKTGPAAARLPRYCIAAASRELLHELTESMKECTVPPAGDAVGAREKS
jgi:myo-inositol-1(or 4)-monophosphatase